MCPNVVLPPVRPARCDRSRESISLRLDGVLSLFEAALLMTRARVRHLDARLVDQVLHVRSRQLGRVEQREDPRERRAELVGDGGCEAGAELVEAAGRCIHVACILAAGRVVLGSVHQSVTIPTPGTYRPPF